MQSFPRILKRVLCSVTHVFRQNLGNGVFATLSGQAAQLYMSHRVFEVKLSRIQKFRSSYCKFDQIVFNSFIHLFILGSSCPPQDCYAGIVQLRRQLPKCALPHSVIRTSLHHFAVTSNLLHWTVWLLSTAIYIVVSRSALLCLIIVYRALWLLLLLAISCLYTFSLPPVLHFVSQRYIASPKLPKEIRLFYKSNCLRDQLQLVQDYPQVYSSSPPKYPSLNIIIYPIPPQDIVHGLLSFAIVISRVVEFRYSSLLQEVSQPNFLYTHLDKQGTLLLL